jgi:hypothetical protein
MTVSSLTTNYSFKLIDFNSSPWHDDEHSNWRMLDGILNLITTVPALYGFWENATAYTANQRVVEEETGKVFRCLVDHTSASSGTFSADRVSNPTYWSELTSLPVVRGQWLTATDYAANDVAYDDATGQYLIANTAHTSGVLADDIAASLWTVIFDVSAAVISSIDADQVVYDNSTSGMTATDAQEAIDELDSDVNALSSALAGKADSSHTHILANITDAGTLAGKNSVALTDINAISDLRVIGNVSGSSNTPQQVEIKDEDSMSSDSATALVTQQSVVAYVQSQIGSLLPTGTRTGYVGVTAPTGWVLANGLTIGNASSNATSRANADTEDLFTLLWNSYSNTNLPIVDSAGSPSTRGASAAADYAANKALPVPDYAGRVGVGRDDLSGGAANRVLPAEKHGIDGDALGAAGGVSEYQLVEAEMPSHVHDTPFATSGGSVLNTQPSGLGRSTTYNTLSAGGDEAHTNMQPSIIETVIIKL